MKDKLIPSIIIISFITIFLIFYKGLQETNIYTPKSEIKKNIPIFSSVKFDSNESVNSSDIFNSNKFFLLNIWASWCVPCRDEHPILVNLSKNKQLEIIGLNYKGNPILGLANFPILKKYYFNSSAKNAYVFENGKKSKLKVNYKATFSNMKLSAAFHGALSLNQQK